MKSLIAIKTYRRLNALKAMLEGVSQHCGQYATAVFEDCGQRDATVDFMTAGRAAAPIRYLRSSLYTNDPEAPPAAVNHPNVDMFVGDTNLGVAGNNNRAIKYFMDGGWDHLLLCDDDLLVTGDFVAAYANAHQDLGVDMFCFCDFTEASPAISGPPESYKWTVYPVRGHQVKFLPRYTGIMMSVTRKLVEKIGYMDVEFGKFGEEHCDWTNRARMAGGIRLNGADMHCLDIVHHCLEHQNVHTSVTGAARRVADKEASVAMQRAAYEYRMRHYYRPFRLSYPVNAGGYCDAGTSCRQLEQVGYALAGSPV